MNVLKFTEMLNMKFKYILALALAVLALCGLAACKEDQPLPQIQYFNVSFDSQGGSAVRQIRVQEGALANRPADPTREGYVFDGWKLGNRKWDFETDKVTADITLSATWISAESIYAISKIGDTDTCMITDIKRKSAKLQIPEVINGYKVVAIGDGVFRGTLASDVSEIILPGTVTSIGSYAFYECRGIRITVKGALTYVGEFAFGDCDGLTSLNFGEGLTEIPFGAFSGCTALREIRLPASLLTVCENAFEECAALTTVMMYASTKSIEDCAFRFCDNLKAVYFYGTNEDFDAIEIVKNGNGGILDADLYLYSATKPQENGDNAQYWYLDEKGKVRLW